MLRLLCAVPLAAALLLGSAQAQESLPGGMRAEIMAAAGAVRAARTGSDLSVAEAALNRTVIESIATRPRLTVAIVHVAVGAAPASRRSVVHAAARAFPGFLSEIERGARPLAARTDYLADVAPASDAPGADAAAGARAGPLGLSEIIVGVAAHDVGAFGRNKEDGNNLNFELRFDPLDWTPWRWIFAPEPHVGVHINSAGHTNQLYAGATWSFDLGWNLFFNGSLGLSFHDGETDTDELGRKELGLSVLFRESLELGVRMWRHHAISFMLDHISNAGLVENNEGLDTFGLRYGYRL